MLRHRRAINTKHVRHLILSGPESLVAVGQFDFRAAIRGIDQQRVAAFFALHETQTLLRHIFGDLLAHVSGICLGKALERLVEVCVSFEGFLVLPLWHALAPYKLPDPRPAGADPQRAPHRPVSNRS
jgi:hypothetical protein